MFVLVSVSLSLRYTNHGVMLRHWYCAQWLSGYHLQGLVFQQCSPLVGCSCVVFCDVVCRKFANFSYLVGLYEYDIV